MKYFYNANHLVNKGLRVMLDHLPEYRDRRLLLGGNILALYGDCLRQSLSANSTISLVASS